MCGIVGLLNLEPGPPVEPDTVRRMLGMIRHRGPDSFGIFCDDQVGLGNARLSIIDLSGGQQPIGNEDDSMWIVYNGEVFNYPDLREELERRGHRFTTNTDTEVILHLYEDEGPRCLEKLNGQFALAIWDTKTRSLFLARDRMGIRPLFYAVAGGQLLFGSEIKAIFACPEASRELDPLALRQILTFWSTLSPRTVFSGVQDVPPGHYLLAHDGKIEVQPFWQLDLAHDVASLRSEDDYLDEFEALLINATQIRLRADVQVGAYLSGGLDSSITSAIIRNYTQAELDTYSIAFEDAEYDESHYQQQMAQVLGTHHRVAHCQRSDVGRVFPQVIWHTETPILRTSPAPMFMLSELVNANQLKVVLTGEGADEILAGYNIFKETQVRRFWARNPESELRPLLLRKLYPYIASLNSGNGAYLRAFFKRGLSDTQSPFYSHAIRWANGARIRRFLLNDDESPQQTAALLEPIALPAGFGSWSSLGQAQYLEMSIFLSQYLLSSQGDRMLAAHSVEGRFPFLDYRVVEFANRLPPSLKLKGLTEKWLLKRLGSKLVPAEIWQRPKQPYRAPIQHSFFNDQTPDYVPELLGEEAVQETALFKPAAVAQLVKKASSGRRLGEVDEMALVAILSTQLVHHQFVRSFELHPLHPDDDVKLVDLRKQYA